MNSKFVTGSLKNLVSIFLIGGIWLWSSSIKAEIVLSPKYTAQQLEGIVERNVTERSDGVSERVTYSGSQLTIERPSKQTTKTIFVDYSGSVIEYSLSDWEVRAASQNWLSLNRGDGSKNIVRYVLFRF